MKQRLLYAILLLFGVFGMANADIQVTVPKGETATLQLIQRDGSSESPAVTISGNPLTRTGSGQTYNYTVSKNDSEDQTVVITTLYGSLKVTGKASAITVNNGEFTKLEAANIGLKTLTLAAATQLAHLDVSNNADLEFPLSATPVASKLKYINVSGLKYTGTLDFSAYTVLETLSMKDLGVTALTVPASVKTLDVSGNAVKSITGLADDATVTWGTQKLDNATYSKNANVNFSVADLATNLGLSTADESYTVSEWKKLDANGNPVATSDPQLLLQGNTNLYRFFDQNTKVYQSGTYQVKLKSSKGEKYFLTKVTIAPAAFTVTFTSPTTGTITAVSGGSSLTSGSSVVKQGDDLAFTLDPFEGYQFASFTDAKGLKLSGTNSSWNANPVYCVVEGKYVDDATDEAPSIKAEVTGNNLKVTIPTPDLDKGVIKVERLVNDTYVPVHTQDMLPYGTKVRVTVTPQPGYYGSLLVNGSDMTTGMDISAKKVTFVKEITINEATEITATFIPLAKSTITLVVDGGSDFTKFDPEKVEAIYYTGASVPFDGSHTAWALDINSNYQLKFVLKSAYELKEITMDGKGQLEYTDNTDSEGKTTYIVSLAVPAQDATIHITTKELQNIAVTIRDDQPSTSLSYEQIYTYDGNPKELVYTTVPANLSGFKVEYQLEASAGYGEVAPTNAGTYNVKVSREQKNGYKAVSKTAKITINKATPEITIPTVTVEDGKYVLKNGAAKFNGKPVEGTFKVTDPSSPNTTESHLAKVNFTPSGADELNFNGVNAYQEVVINGKSMDRMAVNVSCPTGVSATLTNGGGALVKSGDKFVKGTNLYLLVNYPEGVNPANVNVSALLVSPVNEYPALSDPLKRIKAFLYTVPAGTDADRLTVTVGEVASKEYSVTLTKYEPSYTGSGIQFPASNITVKRGTTAVSNYQLTYFDANNKQIVSPENVGTYKVRVTIPVDVANGYKAFDKTFEGYFVIKQATPTITKWPTARPIAKGQTLSQAALVAGSSNVSGTFDWLSADKSKKPTDGEEFVVVFTPDNANYETVTTGTIDRVAVTVSDLQLITFNPKNGTLIVKDSKGNTYESGDPISQGTTLTFTAKPDDGFVLSSISVNGAPLNGSTYVVGTESIAVDAVFKVKEVIEIDPNSQYSVTLPAASAVRGVVISKTGTSVVKKDQPFSFTVSTLAADAQRVVVKAGGTTLTPTNGVYTINKVTANTTITVTLDNPTPIKAVFEQVTKNAKGYLMGTVQVIAGGLRAYDQVYYYGDEVTLIAYPESGVTFAGWTDNFTISSNIRTVTLTQDIEIRPIFKGVPTDVESIESAEVIGGDDCIIIRGVADARVTIVSMEGRSQQQMVNGDTRIQVRDGVYGVILEQGKAVIRDKIVVR